MCIHPTNKQVWKVKTTTAKHGPAQAERFARKTPIVNTWRCKANGTFIPTWLHEFRISSLVGHHVNIVKYFGIAFTDLEGVVCRGTLKRGMKNICNTNNCRGVRSSGGKANSGRKNVSFHMILEYCVDGAIEDILDIKNDGRYAKSICTSLHWAVKALHEAAKAVSFLHNQCSPPVCHRDIGCRNLLVHEGVVKLCDFGLSDFADGKENKREKHEKGVEGTEEKEEKEETKGWVRDDDREGKEGGTVEITSVLAGRPTNKALDTSLVGGAFQWMSPESFVAMQENRIDRDTAGDVYQFGITMWELLARQFPHKDLLNQLGQPDQDAIYKRIRSPEHGRPPPEIIRNNHGEQEGLQTRSVAALEEIMAACWATNPKDRTTMEDVVQRLAVLEPPLAEAARQHAHAAAAEKEAGKAERTRRDAADRAQAKAEAEEARAAVEKEAERVAAEREAECTRKEDEERARVDAETARVAAVEKAAEKARKDEEARIAAAREASRVAKEQRLAAEVKLKTESNEKVRVAEETRIAAEREAAELAEQKRLADEVELEAQRQADVEAEQARAAAAEEESMRKKKEKQERKARREKEAEMRRKEREDEEKEEEKKDEERMIQEAEQRERWKSKAAAEIAYDHHPDASQIKRIITTMRGGFDEQTCVVMWEEVDRARGCKSFGDLTSIWYRNLEEYAITGTVESGEFPFVVEFCTSDWLPKLNDDELKKLLDYFCELDEDEKLRRTQADFYRSISEDKGRALLKVTLQTHKKLQFRVSIE